MALHPVVHIQQGRVDGLCHRKIVDGVGQQQGPRLGHAVLLPAFLGAAEDACDLPARGVAQQGVTVGVHAKRGCMGRDELHRPAQIVQRGVVARLLADAVAQHEHRIPLLVELPRGGDAAPQLAAVHQRIAREDDGVLGPGLFGREIIQLCVVAAGLGGDLLVRINFVGHLPARLVVFHQQVQPGGAAGGRGGTHHLLQRLVVVGVLEAGVVPLPGVDVGVEARGPDGRVRADLPHGGGGGDVGCLRRQSQQRSQQQACPDAPFVHDSMPLFSFTPPPAAARTPALPRSSPRRRCRGPGRSCGGRCRSGGRCGSRRFAPAHSR